jgi:hypothetical protein
MTKDDRSFESSVLKYMMQDFTRLSVRERTGTPSKSQLSPEVSSYRESTSANAQLGIANQVPNYGTSSLFLTVSHDGESNISDSSSSIEA